MPRDSTALAWAYSLYWLKSLLAEKQRLKLIKHYRIVQLLTMISFNIPISELLKGEDCPFMAPIVAITGEK